MLLGEEQHRPIFPEFSRPDQSADRAVSLRHMHAGRLVIFLCRNRSHPILAQGHESGRDASVRMPFVQFVSPNRIELVQLIVQRVAAIFCYQDGVFVVYKRDIIE